MPQDNQDNKPAAAMGRTYRGQASPPITTAEAVAKVQATQAEFATKPGAVDVRVYFAGKGIDNPILQASLLAYTDVRTATPEDFDKLFAEHHEVPAPKTAEEIKRP